MLGGGGGGGFRGGRGGGGGGGGRFDSGPPERVIPLGIMDYPCQDDLVCKVQIDDVPYFNAPIFLENKEQIGKIDEIFGTIRDYSVTIKLSDNLKASSFNRLQKVSVHYLWSFKTFVLLFHVNSSSSIRLSCCRSAGSCPSRRQKVDPSERDQEVVETEAVAVDLAAEVVEEAVAVALREAEEVDSVDAEVAEDVDEVVAEVSVADEEAAVAEAEVADAGKSERVMYFLRRQIKLTNVFC